MHSIFESWDEGSLNLFTHAACFQGASESEELWKSWLCLSDRWICEGGEVALLGSGVNYVFVDFILSRVSSLLAQTVFIEPLFAIFQIQWIFCQNDLCSFFFSFFLSSAIVFKLNKHWGLILRVLQLHHSLPAKCKNFNLFEIFVLGVLCLQSYFKTLVCKI